MCEKLAEENKLEDVSGIGESKQHLGRGSTGINRHDQHIPEPAKLYQITTIYRKEFRHYGAKVTDSLFGQSLAREASITVPLLNKVQDCQCVC